MSPEPPSPRSVVTMPRHRPFLLTALVVSALTASCAVHPRDTAPSGTPTGTDGSVTTGAAQTGAPTTSTSSATATTAGPPTTSTAAPPSCEERVAARLTPEQGAGQLVMTALHAGSPADSMEATVRGGHVGNVLYLGGWSASVEDIAAASATMQDMATRRATGGVGLLVAADQEGGNVQQLRGQGFSDMPTALVQGSLGNEDLAGRAEVWGGELAAAGVNLNLAPVADVVPAELGRGNGPIGRWDRQYGHDPETVAAAIVPFIHGMERAGVATSVKHFPGIGRITGNPDFTTDGLVDDVLTADDPYLDAFAAGIDAGASTVMVSSALYPKIDPDHPAMFSPAVVDGLLRDQMGFDGVVVSDDVNAAAVRALAGVDPAVDFVAAGGDIVLTGDTAAAPQLVERIVQEALDDRDFAEKVDRSVLRVLKLKDSLGLLPCG